MNDLTKHILKDNFYTKLENCTFEYDKLNRKNIAMNLIYILQKFDTSDGLILAIDSAWGGGKTTFIKMWKNMLDSKSKIPNFYFSAWEDDHTKEPLVAIFSELHSYLKSIKIDKGKLEKLSNIADKFFTKNISMVSQAIVKKMFENAGINDKILQELTASLTENTATILLEYYEKEKETILQLKKIINEILTNKKIAVSNDMPFIIFIDELDRTRPTYAIEMLETIKHLFGIPNLIFVISIDKAQLSKSIQAVYGDIDTQNYLRRFFDLEFILPKQTNGFLAHLDNIYNLKTIKMSDIIKTDNLSLRELEHFASQIMLLELFNKDKKFNMAHGAFILFIKMQDENLYKQIPNITDIESLTHLAEKLACDGKRPIDNITFREYIKVIYAICDIRIYNSDRNAFINNYSIKKDQETGKLKRIFDNGSKTEYIPDNTFSYIVNTYYDLLQNAMNGNFLQNIQTKDILQKIDFVAQFK